MSGPVSAFPASPERACGDALRRLLYERVGRFFDPAPVEASIQGTCPSCGATVAGFPDANKNPICYAKRSMTRHRRRVDVGHPVEFGAPVHPTSVKNSLVGTGSVMVVEERRTRILTNCLPTLPLPPEMTAAPIVTGGQGPFLVSLLESPPVPPFLFLVWNKKADVPLVMSHSLGRVVVCGSDKPRTVDLRVVRRCVERAGEMGADAFRDACAVRRSFHEAATVAQRQAAIAMLEELRAGVPFDLASLPDYPLPGSGEYEFVAHAIGADGDPDVRAAQ